MSKPTAGFLKDQMRQEADFFTEHYDWDSLPVQVEDKRQVAAQMHERRLTERQRMVERAIAAGDNGLAKALLSMPV